MTLPIGFEALEPFAAVWAIDNAAGRAAMRGDAAEADRRAFYQAASPLLEPALAHLDARPLADLEPRETRLMHLMLSLAHVALAEEMQQKVEAEHTRLRRFMPITRAPADL